MYLGWTLSQTLWTTDPALQMVGMESKQSTSIWTRKEDNSWRKHLFINISMGTWIAGPGFEHRSFPFGNHYGSIPQRDLKHVKLNKIIGRKLATMRAAFCARMCIWNMSSKEDSYWRWSKAQAIWTHLQSPYLKKYAGVWPLQMGLLRCNEPTQSS